MAFWTSHLADPKRKYRFKLTMFEEVAWYVKSVSAPSYEITSVEHSFSDHTFYFPGKIKWSDVEVTLVDPAGDDDVVHKTLELIRLAGYKLPKREELDSTGQNSAFLTFTKEQLVNNNGKVTLETQDAEGNVVEKWTLNNAFITNVKFGDFDYSSDDLREISLTVKYDWASCTITGGRSDVSNKSYFEKQAGTS